MTLTPNGFDGNLDEGAWARIIANAGQPYAVGDADDFKVTTVSGSDRTLAVAAGAAYGHGVEVVSDAQETVQLPVVASGTRWDLVCLRRDWTANSVDVTFVQGTSAQQVPAARNDEPGTGVDDQPLALVQVTAGQQVPTAVLDLRAWASKTITAGSLLAVPDPKLGTEVWVGDVRYRRVLSSLGLPAWAIAGARPSRVLWGPGTYLFTYEAVASGVRRELAATTVADAPVGEYMIVGEGSVYGSVESGRGTMRLVVGGSVLRQVGIGAPVQVPSRQAVHSRYVHGGGSLAVTCSAIVPGAETYMGYGDLNITWVGPAPA